MLVSALLVYATFWDNLGKYVGFGAMKVLVYYLMDCDLAGVLY